MAPGHNTTHFSRLLDRIRAGEPSAREQLVNDAYQRVQDLTSYILRGEFPRAGQQIETDEIVSLSLEKFLRRLRKGLPRVPDNPAELFGLVGVIVRRVVICEVRRRDGPQFRTQFPSTELPTNHVPATGKGLSEEVLARLAWQEMVEQLPEDEVKLITWKYLWAWTNEEIAEEIKCNPSTVSKRLRIILLKLRQMLPPRQESLMSGHSNRLPPIPVA
jgi:DNA-directed RNA polymerase specialized sigma24 family protein